MRDVQASPFDDIRRLLTELPGPRFVETAAGREKGAASAGSLGRLDAAWSWLEAWGERSPPSLDRPLVSVFAASHGTASPERLAAARTRLDVFAAGDAAINRICAAHGLGFKVFDLALDLPTPDIGAAAAMDEKTCVATMAFGMESIAGGADLLAIGDLGGDADIAAGAIYAALFGGATGEWAEAGDDRAATIIGAALARHAGHLTDPLKVLARLGGRDIAAMAGAILAARLQRVPIVLDGLGSCAAAAVLQAMIPDAIEHCLAGHHQEGAVQGRVLARLGKSPLLDLGLTIGEGTGAALAVGLLKATVAARRKP